MSMVTGRGTSFVALLAACLTMSTGSAAAGGEGGAASGPSTRTLTGSTKLVRTVGRAGQSGLLVTPTAVVLQRGERSALVHLANRGISEETYRISLVNRRMLPDGSFVEADRPGEGEGFANAHIRFAPRRVRLRPGETQVVRLMVRRPRGVVAGEYRSHMLFQRVPRSAAGGDDGQQDDSIDIRLTPVFGVSIPIILRYGALTAGAGLRDPRFRRHPTTGRPEVAVVIERSGTRSLRGNLVVTLEDGTEVGRANGVAVYLSSRERRFAVTLDQPRGAAYRGRTLTLRYEEGRGSEVEILATANLLWR